MSHYNNTGGYNNPAYHDSDTLEIDRSPSRKSQSHHSNPHGNPYPRDDGAGGERGRSDLQQLPGGVQSSYDEAQERVPWGGWQEGSWRGRDSIPMGLLPPRSESPRWQQHDLNHSGYQIEQATHYDTTPPVRLPSATSGHVSMRFRGSRKMSLFPVGEAALGNLGLSEDDIRNEMENEEHNLVQELVAMSTRDRIKAIRDLPMSFDDKKHIRGQVLALKSFKKSRHLNCFADCSKTVSLAFRRCGANMTLAKQTLELWRGTMKEVGGKFGTGVLSYFKFLKWLLMFNIFSFLVNFGFITIPQLIYHPTPDIPAGVSFKGLEILTGAGYFSHTVMYYGGYSNKTQGTGGRSEYNMQLAYFFTVAAYMVLCGAALIYSMASSFRKKYVLADSGLGGAWQLLCSWDFSVTNEKAVRQRKNNLRIQLKESLSEKVQVALLPLTERLKHYGVFLGTWLLSTGMALGCGASVYFLCQYDTWRTRQSADKVSGSLLEEAATLLLPFVVSLINLVVPLFYSLFKKIEHYSNPRMQVYAIIVRNVILKMSILGILCYYWMKDVANTFSCWESIVGQALYRLVIMDFLFIMLGSFFGEFLSNVIGTKCIQSLGVPEFDVARNVLDLIYAQTLAWIGIYFSPLLPVIQIIKFFILFYLKKVSLTQNCQPPRRAGRAAQMQTIFIAILFFPSFVGALSMVAYTVWTLPPSDKCGPFRGLNTTFSAIQIWMDDLNRVDAFQWTVWIYQHVIRSEIFYFLVSLIILVFIYIFRQITQGRQLLIILLRQQIVNEGKDKAFLLEKLQNLQKSKQNKRKKKKQVRKRQENESSSGMLQALIARQRLEQENGDSSSSFGVPMPSGHSVSTTSSAMMQAMLARQYAEDQDVASYRGVPFPADQTSAPSSALIQAMQARQRAESQNEDEFYRAPVQSQNPVNALPSAMIQVMQARQRAESEQEEDQFYRVPVHSEHPVSSTPSAMMQVMQARQRAEEEESEFYRAPASSQHPDASGTGSALIQAMLARQQVEEEYGDRY
ncbi:transmembrane channel-like protein 5 isoform X1 [Oncorhynchus kisutch]|uniref:transmembrane channel-like protein 5 isoform X1 n=1 Tax=Oncorhynchus kisutch TaxID=8019 RepID=UPI0012DD7F0B|nr:transmembrane channel-like protein 5 isoform X1 [Oncorhynchus kisutch]XP_031687668.1 transmembrane channel-like protein 5 isoform X1 [Oncorhynchus kisutch]XP_031687678.1 transmembrane channel-like protein 5 isoform X1 [Oncorhynchus kisutch]